MKHSFSLSAMWIVLFHSMTHLNLLIKSLKYYHKKQLEIKANSVISHNFVTELVWLYAGMLHLLKFGEFYRGVMEHAGMLWVSHWFMLHLFVFQGQTKVMGPESIKL